MSAKMILAVPHAGVSGVVNSSMIVTLVHTEARNLNMMISNWSSSRVVHQFTPTLQSFQSEQPENVRTSIMISVEGKFDNTDYRG